MATYVVLKNANLPDTQTYTVVLQEGQTISPEYGRNGWTVVSSSSDPDSAATSPYGDVVTLWKPLTKYSTTARVLLPNGAIGHAVAAFTSGAVFDATKWTVDNGSGGSDAGAVSQWRLSADGTTRQVAKQPDISWQSLSAFPWQPITVDSGIDHQSILGFGAALTDASAELLMTQLTSDARRALLTELFDPAQGGLSILRIPIGASDYSRTRYTLDDQPSGSIDPNLNGFAIDPDLQYRIPVIREILAINPRVRILATPWSPPAWMKTDPSVLTVGSSVASNYYLAYAQYFVRFIQAYADFGINIWAIAPQNEPTSVFSWPGCLLSATNAATFIGQFLGPAFDTAGINTRIFCFDDSWGANGSSNGYAEQVLGDTAAGPYLEGAAWHWYGGDPKTMTLVQRKFPAKSMLMTEACGTPSTRQMDVPTSHQYLFIGSMRNQSRGIVLWNIALDPAGQPMNRGNGEILKGLYTIASDGSGTVTRNTDFWTLMQTARFVRPGSVRIASSSYSSGIQTVAYRNQDGSITLVAWNSSPSAITTTVADARSSASVPLTLPAGEVATLTWSGVPAKGSPISVAAPSVPAISATAKPGRVQIAITTPSTSSEAPLSGYLLYRGTSAATLAPIAALPPTANGYVDSTVPQTASSNVVYALAAVNSGNRPSLTAASSTAVAVTQAPTVAADPAVTVVSSNGSNALTWAAASEYGGSKVTGWKVFKGTTAGVSTSGAAAATLPASTLSWTDGGLNNGAAVFYKVVAINAVGSSAGNNEKSGTPNFTEPRATAKPATATQPTLWLRGDQVSGVANGGDVASWPDVSGAGVFGAATVPAGALPPSLITNAQNSQQALRFRGTNQSGLAAAQRMLANGSLKAENSTILFVARVNATVAAIPVLCGAAADAHVAQTPNIYYSGGKIYTAQVHNTSNSNAASATAETDGTFAIVAVQYDTAANNHVVTLVRNGATPITATPTGYTTATASQLAIAGVGGDVSINENVDFAEILVFAAKLSDADRHSWIAYLGTIYNIGVGAN